MDRKQADECCVFIDYYDDDVMIDISFERIHTPLWTVRSSTATMDSPSSKWKEIRLKKGVNINEEVDVYICSKWIFNICPLRLWKENCFKYPKVAIGSRKR